MPIDEKMWMLDKAESLALSSWLAQAGNVRREINRLSLENWGEVKTTQALSRSILRRYIGYWNAHQDLMDRAAMGTHGGNYAEELVAAIVRVHVTNQFEDKFDVRQNVWLSDMKKEPDISIWTASEKMCVVLEVKTVLDKAQWSEVKDQREKYLLRSPSPDFRLIALRATGLTESIREEITREQWACVLWDKGGAGAQLRESAIKIWKPIEDSFEAMMQHLKLES